MTAIGFQPKEDGLQGSPLYSQEGMTFDNNFNQPSNEKEIMSGRLPFKR